MEQDTLTTPEARQLSGLSKVQLARLCRESKIDCIKRGRDWFISRRSLVNYMAVWHPEKEIEPGSQSGE